MERIRLAIAGIGNCASALLQGIEYYRRRDSRESAGLLHEEIGGYGLDRIDPVAAFDIDRRKIGRPLEQAVFAPPNCTKVFQADLPRFGITVEMGPVLDGAAPHMERYPESSSFRVAKAAPCDVAGVLRDAKADVLVCYLPVGSEEAVRHYARAALEARVAFVNCVPVFITSDPAWAGRFAERNVPLIGDDVKSQVGATILHRVLARLLGDRGVKLLRTYQLNTGGNTDFLNMLEHARLASKKRSKTESVQSQLDVPLDPANIHIGPADYVPWQKDNKVGFIRLEWSGFGDVPMHLEMRLSVEDSPNSAGVVIDAIRCAKLARDRGQGGPLHEISSFAMKSPPRQLRDSEAREALERWIADGERPASARATTATVDTETAAV